MLAVLCIAFSYFLKRSLCERHFTRHLRPGCLLPDPTTIFVSQAAIRRDTQTYQLRFSESYHFMGLYFSPETDWYEHLGRKTLPWDPFQARHRSTARPNQPYRFVYSPSPQSEPVVSRLQNKLSKRPLCIGCTMRLVGVVSTTQ